MKRQELIKLLELTQPALSDTDLVPVFTHFMFEEGCISASNNELSIVANNKEIKTDDLKFALNGKTLLGLLKNSTSEDVTFDGGQDHDIVVKAGRSRFNLPFLPEDDFLFEEPVKEKWLASAKIGEIIIEGITTCLITAARDDSMRALMGVCFNFNDNLTLYSCDGDAVTRYYANSTEAQVKGKGAYTVPNKFCEALLKIAKETGIITGKLELSDSWAKATLGDFTIYGRLLENENPLDHADLIKHTLPAEINFVAIPDGFADALARAMVVADPESAPTILSVQEEVLFLITETKQAGVVNDELQLEEHPDVQAKVHASLIYKISDICFEMAICNNCTCYRRQEGVVLMVIANIGE